MPVRSRPCRWRRRSVTNAARKSIATTDPVTVLGAGIGGLTAALAASQAGREVHLLEQAPALTEVGAGLQIAPNGGRVLRALGVDVPGVDSQAVHLFDGPSGRSLIRMPVGPGFRLVHRADLIAALAARVADARIPVRLGARIADIAAGIEAGAITLDDGTAHPFRMAIGADGAHGPSRRFVAPDHQPRFTGQVAWRAIVPVDDWPHEAQVHTGRGRHLVCYPLRDGRQLNIVAVEERGDWVAPGWSQTDDPANMRAAFADFAAPIRALLDRVEHVNLWGLMDHGVTSSWHRDGVTLIGDAAHPTLPFLAQGANLALEDAWVLARHLDDPAAYEAARKARVTRALAAAKDNAKAYHLTGLPRAMAHSALRLAGLVAPGLPLRRYDWLYSHDATRT